MIYKNVAKPFIEDLQDGLTPFIDNKQRLSSARSISWNLNLRRINVEQHGRTDHVAEEEA